MGFFFYEISENHDFFNIHALKVEIDDPGLKKRKPPNFLDWFSNTLVSV